MSDVTTAIPDDLPASGVYTAAVEFAESCCGRCPGPCYVDQVLDGESDE